MKSGNMTILNPKIKFVSFAKNIQITKILLLIEKKKLEKLKELNDSFNSIFKSSIEYLRESNSNRKNENSRYSEIDNSNDTIKIKSPNLFEININITDDDKETINNLHILNKVNSKGNFKNKYLIVIILKI